ncbi:MAG: 8-oxoguanine deaminase [Rhodospirillaceae bacterium]|nr:8-oxoguanine deaminase [Rhodospirillaceae bacterium]MCY4310654.1 8-oxoguanine deaminase [Rhodospirillaceae bacterium]
MRTLLVRNARVLAVMDDAGTEIPDGGLFCCDGIIEQVGPTADLPTVADQVIELADHVVIPGLVNTHHHLCQNLTRAVPMAQDASLFGWLQTLYPIWQRMGPDHLRISALVGMAELALSGCTTSSDHLYLFPNGSRLDDQIQSAVDLGFRFTATRGSMSIGESKGGLPPDSLTEDEDAILEDCIRVVDTFHDPGPQAMVQVAIAPCSPFTVSQDLMRQSAVLAREKGVRLHTHLAENVEDIDYSLERFGMRPGEYIEDVGWVGEDVWHAHCVQLDAEENALFARTGTGIAHCPCSNMRLASGIAPVRAWLDRGVKVGLGVDGSASNDDANLLTEARQAMLLQRVKGHAAELTAREALRIATRGGAAVLGREDDIGSLEVGKNADFAAYDLNTPAMAGTDWDPLAALIFCRPAQATWTVIGGRPIVRDGLIASVDFDAVLTEHRRLVRMLMDG